MTDKIQNDVPGETSSSAFEGVSPETISVRWRDVPTVLSDQIIGFAAADGIARLSFGELAFNPGGGMPYGRPVVTIASTLLGWKRMVTQISDALDQMDDAENVASDESGSRD